MTAHDTMREARLRERARDHNQPRPPLRRRGQVCVVHGYGVRIHSRRGQLIVEDGVGRDRRKRIYDRADRSLIRLVVRGHAGSLSLEAIRWLTDVGVGLICLDTDSRILAVSGRLGVDEPHLRRAQAIAAESEVGLEIGQFLLMRKLRGQLEVAGELPDLEPALTARATIAAALHELEQAGTLDELRQTEARAAKAYWQAWNDLPLTFTRRDASSIPDSWRTFGSRTSVLSGGPRLAITPGNSLANYLYGLAESEAALALRAVGLDAGIGVAHVDQRARDSLALDLLEAVRPEVDRYLLALPREHTFTARDFFETRRGSVRVLPPLTHQLAQTLPAWAERLAPLAEAVAETLLADRPTPLTQSHRSAGRDQQRRRQRRRMASPPRLPSACRTCGTELTDSRRSHCDACLPGFRAKQRLEFAASGPAAVAALRADGRDPAHGGEAARRRSETMKRRQSEAAEWDGRASVDSEQFTREILSAIQGIPLRRLADATGLSLGYCGLIRRGERVPHPRHWSALREEGSQ
jgi:CRISPR-associated protein Cas1